MKELVVISGKGGTGKTSVTASLAVLAGNVVVADCDVDAADLHLVLAPEILEQHDFISGHEAVIRSQDCMGCGTCLVRCRYDAIACEGGGWSVDPHACEGCGVCVRACPVQAIDFPERHCGRWFVSTCRTGPLVHARLGMGAENSGKLVSLVRQQARALAKKNDHPWILVDGPPGIGCPVIASVTGAAAVVIVTEPTLSGEHDLQRVLELTHHFQIPALVCVNKWDINEVRTKEIEQQAAKVGTIILPRIPYDPAVTEAQIQGRPVIDDGECPLSQTFKEIWKQLCQQV